MAPKVLHTASSQSWSVFLWNICNEKFMHITILNFLESHDSLFEMQWSFTPGQSCKTFFPNCLTAQNSLLLPLNKRPFFDFWNGRSYSSSEKVTPSWYQTSGSNLDKVLLLNNRKQFSAINNSDSNEVEIVNKVRQGSLLGPLFLIA